MKEHSLQVLLLTIALVLAGLACRWGDQHASESTAIFTDSLLHDGLERTFLMHVPASYDGVHQIPLVLALHGGGGTGANMIALTEDLNNLADEQGFMVVYPDGIEKHWNDGRELSNRPAFTKNVDDVGFLKTLVERISQDYQIDLKHIYVMGISNGGQMSYRLACESSTTFTAIAAVGSSLSEELFASCAPTQPVSVLVMNGTADPLVPWHGGTIHIGRQEFGRAVSAFETVNFWIKANQCDAHTVSIELPDSDPDDGTRVMLDAYEGCTSGSAVEFFTIEGGGHTWPGGLQYLPEWLVGKTSRDVEANQLIWRFFSEHAKSG